MRMLHDFMDRIDKIAEHGSDKNAVVLKEFLELYNDVAISNTRLIGRDSVLKSFISSGQDEQGNHGIGITGHRVLTENCRIIDSAIQITPSLETVTINKNHFQPLDISRVDTVNFREIWQVLWYKTKENSNERQYFANIINLFDKSIYYIDALDAKRGETDAHVFVVYGFVLWCLNALTIDMLRGFFKGNQTLEKLILDENRMFDFLDLRKKPYYVGDSKFHHEITGLGSLRSFSPYRLLFSGKELNPEVTQESGKYFLPVEKGRSVCFISLSDMYAIINPNFSFSLI